MTKRDHDNRAVVLTGLKVSLGAALAGYLCLLLFAAAPAQAALEEVGCFAGAPIKAGASGSAIEACAPVAKEEFTEEVQLGGVGGMAVNYTGNGGVPKGTVYAATETLTQGTAVAMYEPRQGGEGLEFVESWQVTSVEGSYERCGPLLGVIGGKAEHPCAVRPKALSKLIDVDVDEATGNVYVYNGTTLVGRNAIVEYTADGGEVRARFGEIAPGGKTTMETPGQIHESPFPGGIAVNGEGDVYVFDINIPDNRYHRLMKFTPKPGSEFKEYEYAGTAKDLAAGFGKEGSPPTQPVADAAGNLYVVAEEESAIEEFDPSRPLSGPLCRFHYEPGGITGMTVDPASGRVFFFSYKPPKRVHELGSCDEGSGKFGEVVGSEFKEEVAQIQVNPERDDLWGLAFDPVDAFGPTRSAGMLFGGAPAPFPNSGVGVGEPGQSSLGYIFATPEEVPPSVGEESVVKAGVSSAQLRAIVNPKNFPTTYYFEYLTAVAYAAAGETFTGATKVPPNGGEAGEGKAPVAVGATLAGLLPDTEYIYRAVAANEGCPANPGLLCETVGAVQAFHTFPAVSTLLPDGRAYELVSPSDKHGGQVFPANASIGSSTCVICKPGQSGGRYPMQSSPNGNMVAYEGSAFSPGAGATGENEYLATRGAGGWQTTTLAPALMNSGSNRGYVALSRELSGRLGLIKQLHPSLSPQSPGEYANLYAQPASDPFALTPLVTLEPGEFERPATGTGEFEIVYAGSSVDLSKVFFTANDALTKEVPGIAPPAPPIGAGESNLYEWEATTGQLSLVNVLPGNASAVPGVFAAPGSAHIVSADGEVAFWADAAGRLYARLDGERTVEVPGASPAAKFLTASATGERVLLSNGHLLQLNEEETAYLPTVDLSAGKGGFLGLLGESDDLARLYFVDTEELTEGEEACREGAGGVEICEEAEAGEPNLYTWGEGRIRFIATLLPRDGNNASGDWAAAPSARTAEASPNGQFLTFLSGARLTGYDNTGPCEVIQSGPPTIFGPSPCAEAFVYSAASNMLICASCNPSNARPLGRTQLPLLEGPEALPQSRYLSNRGRLFFDSEDSLSPRDSNEGVEDVYEWEPSGVGSCGRTVGCLALISAGTGGSDSNFVAADEEGSDVFFTTRDRLVGADTDGLIDLYDAREPHVPGEAVGFPEGLKGGECQGESCQSPPPAPPEPPPASATFNGPGNPKPTAPCKKGKIRRHGKCVKLHKHHSHKKPHKKHSKHKRPARSGRSR